jgi:hypothetical protein
MSVVDDARVVCGAKLPDHVDKVAHVDLRLQPVLAQLHKPAGGQEYCMASPIGRNSIPAFWLAEIPIETRFFGLFGVKPV